MKKIYPIILFLFFFIAAKSQYHTETEYLVFEGYDRSYEIFVPDNYLIERSYPIVFILHGGGGTAKGLIRTTHARFNTLANRDGFIAVYPNGVGKSWNDGARDTIGVARKLNINDAGFFEEMIKDLQQKYSIVNNRIFACGISNGGFMVQRLAFELSDKINGIGVVAANLSVVQSTKTHPENPVPVIFINGTSDPLVPFEGGYVTVFRKKRGAIFSVEESVETWKKINSCTEKTGVYEFPDLNEKDGCTAIKTTWQNPTNRAIKTIAITVKNGGHTWPGTNQYLSKRLVGNTNYDFNGCDEIWDFFKSIINVV